MNKEALVLATLSAGKGATHTPVQIQKLLFLIDRNISIKLGGPIFYFQPYNYGPFDKTVYDVLEILWSKDLVEIVSGYNWKEYKLTPQGQFEGERVFRSLKDEIQKYIFDVSLFVRSLSFTQLVSAIYKAYPDMKVNSVFQE